ncbi:MAG TPA: GAF domain-containing protein [Limnobacter sp.]|nr:GAF domain-containing protein [Limnobacter sp.]
MQKPDTPQNEDERTRTIHNLGLIYSPSEARFDRITRLVCRHFDVSTALVSIIYKEFQWFKSNQGLNACSTDREISFCGHAILSDEALVVENALLDPRFMDNPLVTEGPKIRFYAGQPIHDPFGVALGTLCLIDGSPRQFTEEDRRDLKDFARLIEAEIAKPIDDNVVTRFVLSLSEQQRLLLIDPLVGTWNRRGLEALLEKEIEQARRSKQDISLIRLKLGAFQDMQSRFGPERMIDFSKFTASILRDTMTGGCGVASLASDEFVTTCPGLRQTELLKLVDHLESQFKRNMLETQGVKALVDVEVSILTLSREQLDCSPEEVLALLQKQPARQDDQQDTHKPA